MADAGTLQTTFGGGLRSGPTLDAALTVTGGIAVCGFLLATSTTIAGGAPGTFDHALLAFGILSAGVLLLATGTTGSGWIQRGYRPAALGVLLAIVGLGGDLAWTATFEQEAGIATAVRPTVLLLALGVGLVAMGPFAAAWRRPTVPIGWHGVPIPLSVAFGYVTVMTATAFAHPFVAVGDPASGVPAILLQAFLLAGVVALFLARFEPGPGAFTVLLGISGLAAIPLGSSVAVAEVAIFVGVALDGVNLLFDPSPARKMAFRGFVSLTGAAIPIVSFLAAQGVGSVSWPLAVTSGSILLGGIAGWLVSYLVLTPTVPAGTTRGTVPTLAGTGAQQGQQEPAERAN